MAITKEDVERAREYPARRFAFRGDKNSEKRKPKHLQGYPHGIIQLPFGGEIFRESPLNLQHSQTDRLHSEGVWQHFQSAEERSNADEWCDQCGDMVFLYDCLDASVALGYTFQREEDRRTRTETGSLEHSATDRRCSNSIDQIAAHMADVVTNFQPYNQAELICSVPARRGKDFHLPAELAVMIAVRVKLPDITADFSFAEDKPSLKDLKVDEKWDALAGVEFLTQDNTATLQGKSIILVDDKYQSGITLQFVASRLLEKGASKVFGLCAVKTWRDDDNTS